MRKTQVLWKHFENAEIKVRDVRGDEAVVTLTERRSGTGFATRS